MNLSIVVWIIRSYMIDIHPEIEDAARTDGAGDLRILWEIIIPMCLPGIITAAVIAAIFAMNEYLFTLIIAFFCARVGSKPAARLGNATLRCVFATSRFNL